MWGWTIQSLGSSYVLESTVIAAEFGSSAVFMFGDFRSEILFTFWCTCVCGCFCLVIFAQCSQEQEFSSPMWIIYLFFTDITPKIYPS